MRWGVTQIMGRFIQVVQSTEAQRILSGEASARIVYEPFPPGVREEDTVVDPFRARAAYGARVLVDLFRRQEETSRGLDERTIEQAYGEAMDSAQKAVEAGGAVLIEECCRLEQHGPAS